MEEIFGRNGLIARHHPDYEYRPGQLAMAQAVAEALDQRRHLLVEAGTGIGKTLAYLVPAIATGRRVIISTGTKNLQEQIFYKDIPFLQSILPRKFKATYLKGRSNYVCLNRLKRAEASPVLEGLAEIDYFDLVNKWAYRSQTGDRAELNDLPEKVSFWRHIDARSDICIGQKCPDFDPCFITKARQAALESDVVIVNHALFFADLALRDKEWGQVLPDYSAVIFDEAHQIEDIAAQYFGAGVSSYQIDDLLGDISRLILTDVDASREITKASARVSTMADNFWTSFSGVDPRSSVMSFNGEGRFVLRPDMFVRERRGGEFETTAAGERFVNLKTALQRLKGALQVVKGAPPEMEATLRRVEQILFDFEFIVGADDELFVYWAERRGRGVFLQATPIDASGILNDRLFSHVETVVLTSATLTSAGSFDFIRSRLGVERAEELVAGSNYNYHEQSLLYLPPKMPDPRDAGFQHAAAGEIVKILNASRGRAFVLCTSYSQMEALREMVELKIDFPILMQGEGSRSGLLDKFRSTPNAVLFATSSFWQGVDVRGEALSFVIIDKLPFAVPLDPRIVTKGYGQQFRKSLPPSRVTRKIEDVESFFNNPP
jgi:ATP-dependent DNA helicase DinG